jgi:Zn-dependent protease
MSQESSRFEKGSLRLFRIWGIDVRMHWTWLIGAWFDFQYHSAEYTSPVWNAVEYLSIFGIVLLHEFGHVLACRQVGGRADRIVLWPLGGVALVQPPPRPGAFLWSLAAGPLVNVALVPATLLLLALSHFAGWGEVAPDLGHYVIALAVINFGLLVFNLLPIFPLDGGQILQALLWFLIGRARSMMIATVIGFVLGLGLFGLALAAQGWWMCLLAGFALLSSFRGFQQARIWLRMQSASPRADAACPACHKPPPVGEFWRCGTCLKWFDVFGQYAKCPHCNSTVTVIICHECGQGAPFLAWSSHVLYVRQDQGDG